jgi:hypothetical protein
VLAIESYYRRAAGPDALGASDRLEGDDDRGGIMALIHDGDNHTVPDHHDRLDAGSWRALDVTRAFGPSLGQTHCGAGTHSYTQPHENIDGRLYPHGWREPDFDAGAWPHAAARHAFASELAAKEAMPVSLRHIAAASFATISVTAGTTSGAAAGARYHYVVDFGRNFQGVSASRHSCSLCLCCSRLSRNVWRCFLRLRACFDCAFPVQHVNITFTEGAVISPGQEVIVRLGEQLLNNGSVKYHSESNNLWEDTWRLSDNHHAGGQSFVPHEYHRRDVSVATGILH